MFCCHEQPECINNPIENRKTLLQTYHSLFKGEYLKKLIFNYSEYQHYSGLLNTTQYHTVLLITTPYYYSLLLIATHYYSLFTTSHLLITTTHYYSLLFTTTHYYSLLLTNVLHRIKAPGFY